MTGNRLGFNHITSCENKVISEFNKTYNYLIFLRAGKIRIEYDQQESVINPGEMFFVAGKSGAIITLLSNSDVVIYSFQKNSNLSILFTSEDLKEVQHKEMPMFSAMKMTRPILFYLNLINFYIEGNFFCNFILEIKEQELFMLFKEFYTKDQLILFFYPLSCMNIDTPES